MRDTEREADTQAEGEAGSMKEAGCGTWSQDPGIMPWAKGRRQTAEPPRYPSFVNFVSSLSLVGNYICGCSECSAIYIYINLFFVFGTTRPLGSFPNLSQVVEVWAWCFSSDFCSPHNIHMSLIFFSSDFYIAPVDTSLPAVILDKPTGFPVSVYGLYSIFF